jgi:hypothetical protein
MTLALDASAAAGAWAAYGAGEAWTVSLGGGAAAVGRVAGN